MNSRRTPRRACPCEFAVPCRTSPCPCGSLAMALGLGLGLWALFSLDPVVQPDATTYSPEPKALLSLDFHSRPFLDDAGDAREIRSSTELRLRDREHLAYRCPCHHRDAERLCFVDAETHVLVGEPGREAEVEQSCQDRPREL